MIIMIKQFIHDLNHKQCEVPLKSMWVLRETVKGCNKVFAIRLEYYDRVDQLSN